MAREPARLVTRRRRVTWGGTFSLPLCIQRWGSSRTSHWHGGSWASTASREGSMGQRLPDPPSFTTRRAWHHGVTGGGSTCQEETPRPAPLPLASLGGSPGNQRRGPHPGQIPRGASFWKMMWLVLSRLPPGCSVVTGLRRVRAALRSRRAFLDGSAGFCTALTARLPSTGGPRE